MNKRFSKAWEGEFLAVLFGVLLSIPIFFPHPVTHTASIFLLAGGLLVTVLEGTWRRRYARGLLFFAGWVLPSTYWYYLVFPWWQAFLQSVGWVSLLAWVFVIPRMSMWKSSRYGLAMSLAVWALLDTLRQYLPVTEDWWIPHVGYAVWQNPLIVQTASWGGVGGVIVATLFLAGGLVWLRKYGWKVISLGAVLFIVAVATTGYALMSMAPRNATAITFVGVQQSPLGGVYANAAAEDVEKLIQTTKVALQSVNHTMPVAVAWPENMIDPKWDAAIADLADAENIFLVYNRAERTDRGVFNTAIIRDERGEEILKTYKKHAAPGEGILERDESSSISLFDKRVTAQICYDLHYPDIKTRLQETDIVIGMIDDDRFGRLLPLFHAADIAFHAVQSRVTILTAGTSGPTMAVDRYGRVIAGTLPIGVSDVLVTPIIL